MGHYLLHSLKYFIKLSMLIAIAFTMMHFTNTFALGIEELLGEKGMLLLLFVTVISLSYPSIGFTKRSIVANIIGDREDIMKAFMLTGYTLDKEENGVMTFRVSSMIRRVLSMFDDKITLYQEGDQIVLAGARKGVVQVEFRIESCIRNK